MNCSLHNDDLYHVAERRLPTDEAAALEALHTIVTARPEAIRDRDNREYLPLHLALRLWAS
jgi:hypothetical protein